MSDNQQTLNSRWRNLFVGFAISLASFAVLFLLLRLVPDDANLYLIPTLLIIAAAFAVGYRLTTHYHQTLVAWLLSSVLIPAVYLLCAQLLPDARHGWGVLAYFFGASYGVIAGHVGVLLGLLVNRKARGLA